MIYTPDFESPGPFRRARRGSKQICSPKPVQVDEQEGVPTNAPRPVPARLVPCSPCRAEPALKYILKCLIWHVQVKLLEAMLSHKKMSDITGRHCEIFSIPETYSKGTTHLSMTTVYRKNY